MHIQEEIKSKISRLLDKAPRNMGHALGITYKMLTKDEIRATMPVNENTIQPFGILHGGASVALAETLVSIGAYLNAPEGKVAVGVEINANHLRPVKKGGTVSAVAKPIHRGRQTQVWETKIFNTDEKLVCVSRCTLALVDE